MAFMKPSALPFNTCDFFGAHSKAFHFFASQSRSFIIKPLVVEARANARKESAKIRNRRIQKKFNGTPTKPRLSVFCSDKQLYAMLVDDQNKKCLFYGSTLQKSIRSNPSCTTIEAAERVGEELIQTCIDLHINEISSYDRNGCACGARMQAFEIKLGLAEFTNCGALVSSSNSWLQKKFPLPIICQSLLVFCIILCVVNKIASACWL